MATHIRLANRPRRLYDPAFICASVRFDNPYLTQDTTFQINVSKTTSQLLPSSISKYSDGPGGDMHRIRTGYSFLKSNIPLDRSYIRLRVFPVFWSNDLEPWAPRAFLSNTDDHAVYETGPTKPLWTWELNLNNDLGVQTYGQNNVVYLIDITLIAAVVGSYFSVILGVDTELADGGVGTVAPSVGSGLVMRAYIEV